MDLQGAIHPDWRQYWTVKESEYELEDFKFRGPGFYTDGKTESLLVLPSADPAKFHFLMYSFDPQPAFKELAQLPVYRQWNVKRKIKSAAVRVLDHIPEFVKDYALPSFLRFDLEHKPTREK